MNPATSKPSAKVQREEPSIFDWDEAVERAKTLPDVKPRLKIGVGESAELTIESERPYLVTYTDVDDDGNDVQKQFPVVDILNHGSNERQSLAVSAISLQNGLGRVFADQGTLKGVRMRVSAENYPHPKFGLTKGYRVALVTMPTPAKA